MVPGAVGSPMAGHSPAQFQMARPQSPQATMSVIRSAPQTPQSPGATKVWPQGMAMPQGTAISPMSTMSAVSPVSGTSPKLTYISTAPSPQAMSPAAFPTQLAFSPWRPGATTMPGTVPMVATAMPVSPQAAVAPVSPQAAVAPSTPVKPNAVSQEVLVGNHPPSPKDSIGANKPPYSFGAPFEASKAKRGSKSGTLPRGKSQGLETTSPVKKVSPRERASTDGSRTGGNQMFRSASLSSMEGSLPRSTSVKTMRTCRSARLSLSNLSLCASESVEQERRQTERGLERESRWLKRALSEEMRHIETMQEQDAQHEQWRQDRMERQRQAESRHRQRSLHRWEQSCKQKAAEETRQKQESEQHGAAFEQTLERLQADRQAAEARQQEQRQRQQKQAEKRRASLSDLESRKEAERKEQLEQMVKAHEQQQARDQIVRSAQDKRRQQICAKKEQREERMSKLMEAQRDLEEQRLARAQEKQRLQQHNSGAFSARQRLQHDKMQSSFKEIHSRRAEARNNADLQKERRRSDVEQKTALKSQKLDNMTADRQKLWEIRKTAHREAERILRDAKREVHRQSMSSRYSVKFIQEQMGRLENPEGITASVTGSSPGSSSASLQDEVQETRCSSG